MHLKRNRWVYYCEVKKKSAEAELLAGHELRLCRQTIQTAELAHCDSLARCDATEGIALTDRIGRAAFRLAAGRTCRCRLCGGMGCLILSCIFAVGSRVEITCFLICAFIENKRIGEHGLVGEVENGCGNGLYCRQGRWGRPP